MAKWNGTTWVCADFTLTGLLGGSFSNLFPDIINNTVLLETGGSAANFVDRVIVTSGPGLEIERIPGFQSDGRPTESPGVNVEFPLIFEYAGPGASQLQTLHDAFAATGYTQALSLIVKDLAGNEVFRWNLFEFGLTAIEPAPDGRSRYIFRSQDPPDNLVRIERDPTPFPSELSQNPATDTRIEISGVTQGYVVVEEDTANRTLTLTFDYVEGDGIFLWVRNTATGVEFRRSMSVIQESGGVETGRTNYFEVFPIIYQQFTGFGQVEKVKERVVIAYGFSEPG